MSSESRRSRHDASQKLVIYLGLFSSTSCCILGFPCTTDISVTYAFRATCVGYFSCNFAAFCLEDCELSRRILRLGMVVNSLSAWLVSAHWCFGFGEWCILILLVHAFQMFGGMVLVRTSLHLHLLFTFAGSMVGYVVRPELSVRSDKSWAAAVVTVVLILVGGILFSGHSSIVFLQRKVAILSSIMTMSEQELSSSVSITRSPPESRLPGSRGSNASTDEKSSDHMEGLELFDCVGQGSFGKVYAASYKGEKAAVKIMSWEGEQLKRINPVKEAKLCIRMVHPNLVQAFDFFLRNCETEVHGKRSWKEIWIVQEWCDRGTLCSFCDVPRTSGLGLRHAKDILCDICKGCEYLHSQEIIHGDLTSNNVLLKTRENVDPLDLDIVCKVCDFGLARVLDEGVSTLLTSQLGTVSHMPPELIRMENKRLTKKADIYSVGVLLYQVLLGELPFVGKTATQIIIFIASGKRLKLGDDVPEDVQKIFLRSTAVESEERPSAEELVHYFSRQEGSLD